MLNPDPGCADKRLDEGGAFVGMRINDQNLSGISSSQLGKTQETEALGRQGRGGKGGTASGDEVKLSSLAGSLQSLAADAPERAAYLEKLAADVQAGRYSVDSATLSQNIVDDALGNRT